MSDRKNELSTGDIIGNVIAALIILFIFILVIADEIGYISQAFNDSIPTP